MKFINETNIYNMLENSYKYDVKEVDYILAKARELKRLSLYETSLLLQINDQDTLNKLFETAQYVKNEIYGKRVVLFAPLYISNMCFNNCNYCGFRVDNKDIERKALSMSEISKQVKFILGQGHKRILMVSGEAGLQEKKRIDYYMESIHAIYDTSVGKHRIRRVNVNVAPLTIEEFKVLKTAGIGTYQLFQETYHEATYREMHPSGPKSDPDNRMDAVDRAFDAGIDDVGIGSLFGLYDWRFEALGLLSHVEHLEKKYGVGPHTISVPRIEQAVGAPMTTDSKYKMKDDDFKKLVAILRLAVPYTGLILSTREKANLRDDLFNVGVSQISAGSRTSPGGYSNVEEINSTNAQFDIHDERSLEQVIDSLITHDCIPSFCTACYRSGRTGKKFMDMAKPGIIKGKCNLNALLTLKEYSDDFGSLKLRDKIESLINDKKKSLNNEELNILECFFKDMLKGERDEYL